MKKYKAEIWKRLTYHNIGARSIKIKAQVHKKPLPQNFKLKLNNIANTIQTAMLQAEEKSTNKLAAPYSKKLADLNLIMKYWKTPKSGIKSGRNVSEQLNKIRKKIDTESKSKLVRQHTTDKHIRIALKEYNKALPNTNKLRYAQLLESAKAAAKADNKPEEQHYKRMAHAKNLRETFRILQNIIKPEDRSGIRQIDIPSRDSSGNTMLQEDGSAKMTTLTDPTEVEEAIINQNIKHFGQADGTPFTTEDLTAIFGKDGKSQATKNLLQGHLQTSLIYQTQYNAY